MNWNFNNGVNKLNIQKRSTRYIHYNYILYMLLINFLRSKLNDL